jgi:hypothetical protein
VKDRTKLIVAVLVVICLAGICVAWAANDRPTEKAYVTCNVLEIGDYEGCWLDLTKSQMYELNVPYGTDLYVELEGKTLKALYCMDYAGVPTFSLFLSYVTDDEMFDLAIFNGELTDFIDVSVGDPVKISVAGPNKYYSDLTGYIDGISVDREDYDSDEAFANFRELDGGFISDDTFYRSCTPWYGTDRGEIADDFYESAEVDWLICLNTDEELLEIYVEIMPDLYSSELFRQGKVHARQLTPAVQSNSDEVLWFIDSILDTDGKVGIFCTYGKDRTGIYCFMLQALAGVSFEDAKDEFMLSMLNYYGVEKGTPEYDALYDLYLFRLLYLIQHTDMIDNYLYVDWDNAELDDFVLEDLVTGYLIDVVGVSQEKIDALKERLKA